jgi:two-component system, NtrC family, nitrogen regulation sensor histidine kinase NtrY
VAVLQQQETPIAGENATARGSRTRIAFPLGFTLAALGASAATFASVSGVGPLKPASPQMLALLAVNLLLICALATVLILRLARILRDRRNQAAGAKLHARFATLFSIAAALPAIIVAAFLGVMLNRGVESWFSEQVRTVVDNSVGVARSYVREAAENMRSEVLAMSADLNHAAPMLLEDRAAYQRYLTQQAIYRSFAAAYVVSSKGEVLAKAESPRAPIYEAPGAQALRDANQGDVALSMIEQKDLIRATYRLKDYTDAYLYVARFADAGILETLRKSEASVIAYRQAEEQRGRLQIQFFLSYLEIALLVLLGSAWLGISAATGIAAPIGRLAEAAERVTKGDFATRVDPGPIDDEVAELARAFNRMTGELDTKQRDLLSAREDAERRSRFIETVLAGVTAGVLGVDASGRITAANRSAALLLGASETALVDRPLEQVSPELSKLLSTLLPSDGDAAQGQVELAQGAQLIALDVRVARIPDTPGFVLTFDDVTRLVAAQRQSVWKDVARRIAHEIKNPLTPIQLSAERLRRKYLTEITSDRETFEQCTDTIIRQVKDIGRMVDEFSAYARTPEPRIAPADVGEVVRASAFSERLRHPDIKLEIALPDDPVIADCDDRLISQAVVNLLKNAAESIEARRARDGEPKDGRILVRVSNEGSSVEIAVIDNGLGFPALGRARLVEPYMTTREKGTGLGLAIVKRVVEDHGGSLTLEDAPQPGPGAQVKIILPASRTSDAVFNREMV